MVQMSPILPLQPGRRQHHAGDVFHFSLVAERIDFGNDLARRLKIHLHNVPRPVINIKYKESISLLAAARRLVSHSLADGPPDLAELAVDARVDDLIRHFQHTAPVVHAGGSNDLDAV